MGGASSRRKGHQFERDIANELKSVFPEAKRHLEYQFQEAAGFDIDNTGNFRFQCKKRKTYVSINTIKEIKQNPLEIPVLITAADREPAMAVIPFQDFLNLLKKLKESGNL